MSAPLLGDRQRKDIWPGAVIDVDVHAVVPSVETLYPYLAPVWHEHLRERGWAGPSSDYTYPPSLASTCRDEWRPADGRVPASDISLLREHVLDAWDVDYAIVNCHYPIDDGHPDLSSALASAVNDWLIEEWLARDDRVRASIVLPVRHPEAMVREIDRVGDHPGFVQALLPVRSGSAYGSRLYHPVLEAIVRHDLVLGIHWGGSNDRQPPTPSGWPSWFVEEYVAEEQVYIAQLLSLVSEGAFQAFPSLRVSLLEVGFAWLPSWGWRLNKEWKGLRREVPWLNRPPFELIREHVRLSAAPLDADDARELGRIIDWLGSDELVQFATDYPHMHDDSLSTLLAAAPPSMHPQVMAESARRWHRLDAKAAGS
jgi:predicted TIM-barrel fold metal-dependent hydrolase